MKNILRLLTVMTLTLAACTNSSSDKKDTGKSTNPPAVPGNDTTMKKTKETLSTVSIKEILDSYLQMKNAFANDKDANAATAANDMTKAIAGFNKAALTPDQAKNFTDITEDAKEHAEHIGKNPGNIKHQREHFGLLSKDMYQLVKTFGAGQPLYYDHCPMYNDGKGANWISETEAIANPYYGQKMSGCGIVKEKLK